MRALTGMEPDRWGEEQRRGLTIDLGFAWIDAAVGRAASRSSTCPGTSGSSPNMLAGVGPVPAVLFVVAADEGWMPQSAEHLAAVDALGIRHGLLVVTRSDLADPAPALAEAARELGRSQPGRGCRRSRSAPSPAPGCPSWSARSAQLARALPAPDPAARSGSGWTGRSRITGSGTVVTGTLPAGTVSRGDELVVTPSMRPVRVRGMQTLGESAPAATGVARVALNLRGVEQGRAWPAAWPSCRPAAGPPPTSSTCASAVPPRTGQPVSSADRPCGCRAP